MEASSRKNKRARVPLIFHAGFASFYALLCIHLTLQAPILAHFPSWTHKNHQATMKTRYCGHLYSSLLRKRTWWGHRDQVSYYMEGGLKGTEGSPTWGPCRSPSKHFTLVLVHFNGACSDGRQSRWPVVSPCWVPLMGSRGVPFEVERRLE
jgi:hypothetical protein